ncbi:HAMP domain-containing histidine kinase [Halosquirtibacter xylanolyticus]|uniref:sensor histidine kinase n=1 Tax=Halosquirtibacter xylanolyticus TaxID=3374599 RepID=UPI003748955C|nr:HAMP domain-containing histidine kinase [Prolixibacteraceae bacterium]
MARVRKLVTKQYLHYTLLAGVLLLASTPLFYYLNNAIYIEDVDESISLRVEEFHVFNEPDLKLRDVRQWNRFNRDIKIVSYHDTTIINRCYNTFFYDALDNELEPYRVHYAPIKIETEDFLLMVRQNLVESADLMWSIVELFSIIIVVLLISFVFSTLLISQKLWTPFYDTLHQIKNYSIENTVLPCFRNNNIKEFVDLNRVLITMLEDAKQTYLSQKEFSANAAHELQTPVAVIQSKLEMLIQSRSITEDQVVLIEDLFEAVSRLSRINKNLLLLTRLDRKETGVTEKVDVIDLSVSLCYHYELYLEGKKVVMDNSNLNGSIFIEANRTLIEILIGNLIINSIQHNRENGKVIIGNDDRVFYIENDGILGALCGDKVFERYASEGKHSYSNGLGLAIVENICGLYDWNIEYRYTSCHRHRFEISFNR